MTKNEKIKQKRRKKIIHILHHSDSPLHQHWKFDLFTDDWHVRVAKQILEQTKDYEIECWRPERNLKCIETGEKDGIIFKAFPSVYLRFGREYSLSLINELKKQSEQYDILIHLHGIHNHMTYLISYLFKTIPIIAQHHGELHPLFALKRSNSLLRFFCLPEYFFEKKIFKNIDYFFAITKEEKEYLSALVNDDSVKIQTMGVDFDIFRPVDKISARERLGLPLDNKIILYVGRFDETKGVDLILNAFLKLKEKYRVELILIGGQEHDQYYEKARSIGASVIKRVPPEELIPYYSAADIYFCFMKINLGGIGVAPVESLACGTPIVSNTLQHFPTDEKIYLGELPRNENDIVNSIIRMMENMKKYDLCREIAMKHYDWKNIIKNTIKIYEDLFNKYHNRNDEIVI